MDAQNHTTTDIYSDVGPKLNKRLLYIINAGCIKTGSCPIRDRPETYNQEQERLGSIQEQSSSLSINSTHDTTVPLSLQLLLDWYIMRILLLLPPGDDTHLRPRAAPVR